MNQQPDMPRYSVIEEKNPREIVLLRGSGCKWRRCTFCDYHLDFSLDEAANFALNRQVLSQVTGLFRHLEVINSGSFCDLDPDTLTLIRSTCVEKGITLLHFECHWMHRQEIQKIRDYYAASGITVVMKMGVETFDADYRERVMKKGITTASPEEIAQYADEVCLLFGLEGQTLQSMKQDIETGLRYFRRVCVNIMVENTTPVKPCQPVIDAFLRELYPLYRDNDRLDILLNNTDFGVGN